MPVFEVEGYDGGAPVHAVAGAADGDAAVEQEGRKGRGIVTRHTEPEPGSSVTPPAGAMVVVQIGVGQVKPVAEAEVVYRFVARHDRPAMQIKVVEVELPDSVDELEKPLGLLQAKGGLCRCRVREALIFFTKIKSPG